jgi:hypothetical protein
MVQLVLFVSEDAATTDGADVLVFYMARMLDNVILTSYPLKIDTYNFSFATALYLNLS